MKVILLFALFGLSFCQDDTSSGNISQPEGKFCPARVWKELSKLIPPLAKLNCANDKLQNDGIEGNVKEIISELDEILMIVGCLVDELTNDPTSTRSLNSARAAEDKASERVSASIDDGIEERLKGLFKEIGDILEMVGCKVNELISNPTLARSLKGTPAAEDKVSEAVPALIEALGVSPPVSKASCTVGEKLLASDCLKKSLDSDTTGILKDLIALYCKLNKGGAADAAANAAQLLGRPPCLLGDLEMENTGDLTQTLGILGPNGLRDLLAKILGILGIDLLSSTWCPVVAK